MPTQIREVILETKISEAKPQQESSVIPKNFYAMLQRLEQKAVRNASASALEALRDQTER